MARLSGYYQTEMKEEDKLTTHSNFSHFDKIKATGCHSDYTIFQLVSEADRKVYGCVEFHDCPIYLDVSRVLLCNLK